MKQSVAKFDGEVRSKCEQKQTQSVNRKVIKIENLYLEILKIQLYHKQMHDIFKYMQHCIFKTKFDDKYTYNPF